MNDVEATREFLRWHRGWYTSNHLRNSGGRAAFKQLLNNVDKKGKGT